MELAIEKTISFLLFIFIGILLKKKISSGDETNGLKSLILTIALPVTIFLALLKVEIDSNLMLLPLFGIALNIVLFFSAPILLTIVGINTNSSEGKTSKLLIASLAPGLSCFPFILEFLGNEALAKAAMADLGNKFFVLFVLYLVALKWYYKTTKTKTQSSKSKIISLAKTLFYEPVNLFIVAALFLVSFGITLEKMPVFLSETLTRLSYLMTPLVLIFIGLAVKFEKRQFFKVCSLLLLRAGFTLFILVGVIASLGINLEKNSLVMISFALSACSFWPFAHISAINLKEKSENLKEKTFSINFAVSILALSLPISVLLILGILTAGDTFTTTTNILLLAVALTFAGLIYPLISLIKKSVMLKKNASIQFVTEE